MCYLGELAYEWELTNETIDLPLGCLQGGLAQSILAKRFGRDRLLFRSKVDGFAQRTQHVNLGRVRQPE